MVKNIGKTTCQKTFDRKNKVRCIIYGEEWLGTL